MKTLNTLFVFTALTLVAVQAQTAALKQPITPESKGFQVVGQGNNYRVWEKTYATNIAGKVVLHTNKYTELATGMNYNDNGNWLESKAQIDVVPGGAAAVHGPHKVYFPADIYDGAIEIVTPGGKHLKGRPVGIYYDDGSNTVLIAGLTNSVGYLVGSNQVVYPNAFNGLKADLVCTYRRIGFECDLVFREQPPMPEQYEMSSTNSRLQLLTEFFDTAEPDEQLGYSSAETGLTDTTLKFGKAVMGAGKAFAVENSEQNKLDRLPVYKSWMHIQGRTFLIEQLPYGRIAPQLHALPPAHGLAPNGDGSKPSASAKRYLTPFRLAESTTNTVQLAKADIIEKSGVVLDYNIMVGGSTTLTQGTYLVTGDVYFDSVTFEPNVIVKYDPQNLGSIYIGSGGGCCSGSGSSYIYGPDIFTSRDDDSVGETIPTSTGSPTVVSTTGIVLQTSDFTIYQSGCSQNSTYAATFSYLSRALDVETTDPVVLSTGCSGYPIYFSDCTIGINQGYNGNLTIYGGATFDNCQLGVYQMGGCVAYIDNLNFNNCSNVLAGYDGGGCCGGCGGCGGCGSGGYGNSFMCSVSPAYNVTSSDTMYAAVCFDNSSYGCSTTPNGVEVSWGSGCYMGSAYWGSSVDGNGVNMGSIPSTSCPILLEAPAATLGLSGSSVGYITIQYENGSLSWGGLQGTASSDSDGDGLADLWELQYFGSLSHSGGETASNGNTLLYNYLTGRNPFVGAVADNYGLVRLNVFTPLK